MISLERCSGISPRGYSHTLAIRVYAAVQGMVFKPFCQEQGTENTHFRSGTGLGVKFKRVLNKRFCKGPIMKQTLFCQSTTAETDAISIVKAQWLMFSIKICHEMYQEQGMLLSL